MRITRSFAIVVALTVWATAVAPLGAQPGWQQFDHPQYGFSIRYPQSWQKLTGDDNIAFAAIGPRSGGGRDFRMTVLVVTARTPVNESLDRADVTLSRMLKNFREVQVLRTDRVDFRGTPALIKYLTRRADEGLEVYQLMLVLIHERRAYAIIGTTAARSQRVNAETKLLQDILLGFQP